MSLSGAAAEPPSPGRKTTAAASAATQPMMIGQRSATTSRAYPRAIRPPGASDTPCRYPAGPGVFALMADSARTATTVARYAPAHAKACGRARERSARAPTSGLDLAAVDTRATPGFKGGKTEGREALPQIGQQLADLQEKLYANGRTGGNRRVLLVLQGMDTSGKGGTVGHVLGQVDPGGVHIASFKRADARGARTRLPVAHPPPAPRSRACSASSTARTTRTSLAVRVRELAGRARSGRTATARSTRFEEPARGRRHQIVKCFLHISPEEQKERLLARLDDPTKHWKYNPGDLDARVKWAAYMPAYGEAIERRDADARPGT